MSKTIQELHDECGHLYECLRQIIVPMPPRAFGAVRVVLHAYSGRRRRGDIQFYLHRLATAHEGFTLLVVSMDLIISKEYGDAMNEQTCEYWLHAIRQKWVIACLAGPRCE